MFETSTPSPLKPQVANPAAAPVRPNRLPFELETEFAEMQAAAPAGGVVPALLGTTLLFHVLLIAERSMLAISPVALALRGAPVTLLLLLFLLLPARMRRREAGRLFSAAFGLLLVIVLLAGEPFAAARQLLPIQTGVGIMLLLLGWLTLLPRSWALAFSGSMLLADAASILPAHPVSLSVKLESLWALVFASALVVVLATVRESEARREFLLLRQAAFAGVPSPEPGSMIDRHLDPETGVANRLAFDMRFRAAWDQAAARRHSVALLFFSIDNFAEQKRDLGFRFSEILQVQVAGLLKDSLRRSDDMVARFDNQHFVVMLPGVGTDGATQIAERLRGCVEQMAIYAGQKRHSATVTVGAASLRAKRGTPREKLVDCAVQALEQARCTGTNLVCVEGRGCIPRMS